MPSALTTLERLLILCPTAAGLAPETEVTIDGLTAAGAKKVRSSGNSCVAMHRCIVAGRAELLLRATDELEYILWLDGDMVVSRNVVHSLVELTMKLASVRPLPEELRQHDSLALAQHWRLAHAPAVSGAYVKRNDPAHYAARRTTPALDSLIAREQIGEQVLSWELPAVVSGMGALCQTREAFLAHCDEAPRITGDGVGFPAITGAGPAKSTSGETSWGSEDWTYTSWEWQRGRGVYLARHLYFGHVRQSVAWPTDRTLLEGGEVCGA